MMFLTIVGAIALGGFVIYLYEGGWFDMKVK